MNPVKLLEDFQNDGATKARITHRNTKGNVFVIEGKGLHRANAKKELKRLLNQRAAPDVTISDEEVFYLYRIKDGCDIYFWSIPARRLKAPLKSLSSKLAGRNCGIRIPATSLRFTFIKSKTGV